MALLETLLVQLGVDADDLDREARRIEDGLSRVRTNAMSLGKGLGAALSIGPALAPAVTAVGGFAAAFASAGAGIGAFTAAVKPQFAAVTEAADLYTKAQEAQKVGGEQAAKAQQAYKDALAELDPATRATATSFIGLKNDFKAWSDSLAGTTMPIFTKGIEALRGALPMLTPFVKDAAKAIGEFAEGIAKGMKTEGFKQGMDALRESMKQTLPAILGTVKNIAVGFGGIIKAFLPMSGTIAGGLEDLTAKFARWGQGLSSSPAFAAFQRMSDAGGGALGNLGSALLQVLSSLTPVLGATTTLATVFAQLVAAIPTDVLALFGKLLLAAKAATIAYAVVTRTMAIVTGLWTAAQGALNIVMMLNPVGLVIAAIIALIAIVVLIWGKTEGFKNVWNTVWNFIKNLALTVWEALKAGFSAAINFLIGLWDTMKNATMAVWNWLKGAVQAAIDFVVMLFLNFTGPGLIIKHWDTIKTATMNVWNAIKSFFSAVWNAIKTAIRTGVNVAKSVITGAWNAIKGVTSRVWNGIKSVVSTVLSAIKSFITSRVNAAKSAATSAFNLIRSTITNAINRAKSAVVTAVGRIASVISGIKGKVMGALRGAGQWLLNAGKNIIKGLINGIKSMVGSVKNAVSSVVSKARDFLPFSPAKEGPFSGQGAPELSGRAISGDLAKGMKRGSRDVSRAAAGMLDPLDARRAAIRSALVRRAAMTRAGVAGGVTGAAGRVVVDVTGADEAWKEVFRKLMRTSNLVVR